MEPEKKVTRGGVIIPDNKPSPVRLGVVELVGTGRHYTDKYIPIQVEVGERVVFLVGSRDTKSGQSIARYLSENQVLIREVDILFVIPKDSTLEVTL
jgi:co-chaperonin GroES (HSP10)